MADNQQIDILIKRLSERIGTPEDEIRTAVGKSSYGKLLNKLPSDKAFLNSPQAKAIMKRIMG